MDPCPRTRRTRPPAVEQSAAPRIVVPGGEFVAGSRPRSHWGIACARARRRSRSSRRCRLTTGKPTPRTQPSRTGHGCCSRRSRVNYQKQLRCCPINGRRADQRGDTRAATAASTSTMGGGAPSRPNHVQRSLEDKGLNAKSTRSGRGGLSKREQGQGGIGAPAGKSGTPTVRGRTGSRSEMPRSLVFGARLTAR